MGILEQPLSMFTCTVTIYCYSEYGGILSFIQGKINSIAWLDFSELGVFPNLAFSRVSHVGCADISQVLRPVGGHVNSTIIKLRFYSGFLTHSLSVYSNGRRQQNTRLLSGLRSYTDQCCLMHSCKKNAHWRTLLCIEAYFRHTMEIKLDQWRYNQPGRLGLRAAESHQAWNRTSSICAKVLYSKNHKLIRFNTSFTFSQCKQYIVLMLKRDTDTL